MGHQAWLEEPYARAARMGDAYDEFVEAHDLDPEGDHWQAFEDALAGRAEDAQIARGEAREDNDYDDRY